MKGNPVGWFEIPVRDLDRATKFYEGVFNCELEAQDMGDARMMMFPMETGAAGSSGALIKTEGYEPAKIGTVIYFSAPGIEEHLERVKDHGGQVMVPKMSIGEHGYIAHFIDTEGNRVALHAREG